MKRLMISFLLLPCLCSAQVIITGHNRKIIAAGASVPTFLSNFYVTDSGSSSVASITSGAVTIPANSQVYVFCSAGGSATQTAVTASSSPSATWSADSFKAGDSTHNSGSLSSASFVSGGSYTFTCTPSASAPYQSMIGLVFDNGTVTKNAAASPVLGSGSTATVGGFTTSQRTLSIMCVRQGTSLSSTWTAGTINGATTSLRGFSGAVNGTNTEAACESGLLVSAASSASGTMGINSSVSYTALLVGYNY